MTMPNDDSNELKTFLSSVLKSQESTDQTWRTLGRQFGLFFLGLLDSGVEIPHALHLVSNYQVAMLNLYKPKQD